MRRYSTIFARVKRLLLSPAKEWRVIAEERKTITDIIKGYLLPFSLLTIAACYIGYGIVGSEQDTFGLVASEKLGIRYALYYSSLILTSIFISSLAFSIAAPFFQANKSFNRNFKLVAYSFTPMMTATMLLIIPALSPLIWVAGIYNILVFYTGISRITEVPPEKKVNYLAATVAILVFVYFACSKILFRMIVD